MSLKTEMIVTEICTYNVEYEEDFIQGSHDTISLHRKKMTNTLYTINVSMI